MVGSTESRRMEHTEARISPTSLKIAESTESASSGDVDSGPEPPTKTLAKVLEDLSIGIMEASNGDTLDPIIAERTMGVYLNHIIILRYDGVL